MKRSDTLIYRLLRKAKAAAEKPDGLREYLEEVWQQPEFEQPLWMESLVSEFPPETIMDTTRNPSLNYCLLATKNNQDLYTGVYAAAGTILQGSHQVIRDNAGTIIYNRDYPAWVRYIAQEYYNYVTST